MSSNNPDISCEEFLSTMLQSADCSICHESYGPTNHMPVVSPCGHIFGAKCLISWVRSSEPNANTCPYCRKQLFRKTSPFILQQFNDPLWIAHPVFVDATPAPQVTMRAALQSLRQLQTADDGESFLSRLWREIWQFKGRFETDPYSVPEYDYRAIVLDVILRLPLNHPDHHALEFFVPFLQLVSYDENNYSACIIRLARVMLYVTTCFRTITTPGRPLLAHILHLHLTLDISKNVTILQAERSAALENPADVAYLRLITGIFARDPHDGEELGGHVERSDLVRDMFQYWPGAPSFPFLRQMASVRLSLLVVCKGFVAFDRHRRWTSGFESTDDGRLETDVRYLWTESARRVVEDPVINRRKWWGLRGLLDDVLWWFGICLGVDRRAPYQGLFPR